MQVTLMMALRWTLLFILMISGVVVSQQEWSVNYPQKSICAVKESTVTVGCSYVYNATNSTVQESFWSKKLDTNYKNRIQYRNETTHDCSLIMKGVTQDDQGNYFFTILTSDGKRLQGESVKLSVTELKVKIPASVAEGDAVILSCKTTCQLTNTQFTWYKDGHLLYSNKKQLRLQSVSQKDAGDYSCGIQAINYQSPAVALDVQSLPKRVSVSISPSGEIVEGNSVTLTCSSDANPPVETYTWFKGTTSVGTGKTHTINRIHYEDGGNYMCEANNKHGRQFSTAMSLNVLYLPKRVSVSICPSGDIVEGSSVTLTCSSDANPPVYIYTWYKGGSFVRTGKTYTIHKITSENSGVHTCKAENEHGDRSSSVSLNVLYRPKSVSVSISPSGEIMEGSSVTLSCSSDANPPVETYTWYKGASLMRTGKTFTIHRIKSANSGVYTCAAENIQGRQSSTAVALKVLYPPRRVSVSISPSGDIVEGSSVTLTCYSDANPPVETYTWYKEKPYKSKGKTFIINNISSVDSGVYSCKAVNRYGFKYSDKTTVNI
ncbi:B-cell receptor CD22-like, partial [Silurus meridionalis]